MSDQFRNLLNRLSFNVKFTDDHTIRTSIYSAYLGGKTLWNDYDVMMIKMQYVANDIRDEFDKLYETMQYEYNPIENYRLNESFQEHSAEDFSAESGNNENGSSTSNTNDEASRNENIYGYNTTVSSPDNLTSSSENSNTNSDYNSSKQSTETSNDMKDLNHNMLRYGNIGVMTTQQMIQQERDLILNLLSDYVNRFSKLFLYNTWF